MNFKTRILSCIASIVLSQAAYAENAFIVEDIKIQGLQRISAGTVYNYLPVTVGEEFSLDNAGTAIRSLFKTGFFKDITLDREGNTLIVNVVERPSIAKIIIEGNSDIGSDELLTALNKIGLSEGKVFDQLVLEKVEQELQRQYYSHGKYGLKIDTEVTPLTRNRVGIKINISEGRVAKIKQVNIVGNTVFDDETLLENFELDTTNLLSFYTKDDQYSKQKLSADLERLRSYYMDRGYINFTIESTQVAITPDKKEIYITVNVKEGDVFMLEKVKLAGNLIVEPEELIKLVGIGPGEVFSRKQATETSKAISDRLGDEGYVFANVNMVPDINNENKTVDMTFFVDPGKRYYVRNINMKGNNKTRDEVLRREMRQMESSWAATSKIDRSKVRLDRLGYFEPGVNVETPPVVGSSDQIDVNYTVVEKASGNLMAGVGFSQTQGIIFNANVSQDNIFGSGKRVDFSFNNSEVSTVYRFGYYNPYFTLDGVSLGYNLGYTETDARKANTSNYSLNVGNAGTSLGIPLNEYDSIHFNADYKYTSVNTNTRIGTDSMGNPVFLPSKEVFDFVQEEGDAYHTFSLSVGWTHDTLDRAIFPTSGRQQRASALATVPGSDLTYYKLSYKQQNYFPLAKDLTLRLHGEVAYGDGYGDTEDLPFFEHYFAGGVRSVRGFQDNTIGPRDSRNRPFGGSTKAIGNVELLFPVPFFKENKSLRMGTFVDAGSISDGLDLSNFRYSVGISGEWLSPFGALAVSIAQPINADSDDKEQNFQFSFGSNF